MEVTETALQDVYVLPGESHVVSNPSMMRTVLGSCVGVTFWVPRLGIAALCHPMLPNYPANPRADGSLATGRRYVDFAIRDLIRQFDARGSRRGEIQVKLFGGGDVLVAISAGTRPTVGRMNMETALRVLDEEGLGLAASSLGGLCGIHIDFNTGTGEVRLRRLRLA